MIVYLHPTCTTCKKAVKWLEENNISYEARDIRTQTPSANELKTMQQQEQLPLTKMFNTSGQLYRTLGLKEKLKEMTIPDAMELLASDGMLIKRPLLVTNGKALFGFKEEAYEALLKG